METKNEKIFATINELASITGLSRTFIRECCKNGKIPVIRIGSGTNRTYMIHIKKALSVFEKMTEGNNENS